MASRLLGTVKDCRHATEEGLGLGEQSFGIEQ